MDLNLLVALDALLEENSVQGAADRLHLSAPAMSRALTRIRRATGDDILVRTGRHMSPTPRALELREETADLVRRATSILSPTRDLDLAELDRVFTIRCHDALLGALAPGILDHVADKAPQVSIRFVAEAVTDSSDLQRGHVDIDIGATAPFAPEISSTRIYDDRLVVAMRADHSLAHSPLTAADFAGARHVTVSRRGRTRDAVDDALAELGLHRRVHAAIPTSTSALEFVAGSDAITVVVDRMCAGTRRRFGLVGLDLPVVVPPVPAIMLWHRRNDTDPAHRWLRDRIVHELRAAASAT